jgi:adenylate cyclase
MYGELQPMGGGDNIPLLKTRILIGRRPSCDITLRFTNVSSHHCELELVNGYWQVRDLGSRNGIKVNGQRVESQWLLPGDELSIARHPFRVTYTATGEEPAPQEMTGMEMSLLEKAGLAKREPTLDEDSPKSRRKNGAPRSEEDAALDWMEGRDEPTSHD